MCRALYTLRYGVQVSKKQAALWAEKEFPEWATLIEHALMCGRHGEMRMWIMRLLFRRC
jgi:hypothetical protein